MDMFFFVIPVALVAAGYLLPERVGKSGTWLPRECARGCGDAS